MARVENLLGALSLTLSDRLRGVGVGHDMSASEQASLVTLHAHPDRSVSWLGEVLGLTSSGVTRLVERLVTRGWVTRTTGSDARQRRLRLTAQGARRARALLHERADALAKVTAPLSAADREQLERLLEPLVGGLAVDYPQALRNCRLCDRDACNATGRDCPLAHTRPTDG